MARSRILNPKFFTHELLFDSERSSGLPLRVAFAGLWTVADREGRFEWKPRVLKLSILPWDDVDIDAVLETLVSEGFIRRYGAEGEFGDIPSFLTWQKPHVREAASRIPPYDGKGFAQGKPKAGPRTVLSPPRLPVSNSVSVSNSTSVGTPTASAKAREPEPPDSPLAQIHAAWMAALGPVSYGRLGKAFKPVLGQYDLPMVLRAIAAYGAAAGREGKPQFYTPEKFVAGIAVHVIGVRKSNDMTPEEARIAGPEIVQWQKDHPDLLTPRAKGTLDALA